MALIKPMVYAPLVREKFEGKIKVGNLAVNLGYLSNTTVGETVTFPKWKLLSDAEDVVKGTAIGTEGLDQDSSTATIKMVAPKGTQIYDMDNITMIGNAVNEAAEQHGKVIARKLDDDLITEALTSPLKSATVGAKAITGAELLTALTLYGDERDTEDFAGIVINSLLLPSFIGMPEFTSVEKTYNTQGNGIVSGGIVGYFLGIPVLMTDKGTYDAISQECITFIIKKNSLGYMTKRDINTEEKREPDYKRSTIFSDMIYAVKLLADDGVVVVRKTIA
ncbi:phage major capsid protein [Anaerosporobacter sp.]